MWKTVDANFRLKNRDRRITSDRPLGDGWAHFVPDGPFAAYVTKYGLEVEVCLTCGCDGKYINFGLLAE
jgi:hypothetical protein